jgi:hypothetical protein
MLEGQPKESAIMGDDFLYAAEYYDVDDNSYGLFVYTEKSIAIILANELIECHHAGCNRWEVIDTLMDHNDTYMDMAYSVDRVNHDLIVWDGDEGSYVYRPTNDECPDYPDSLVVVVNRDNVPDIYA